MRERLRNGRLRGEDNRYRVHERTGGTLVVFEQSTHVVCFVGFHELEQLFTLGVVQFDKQVGGVVRFHLFEDLRGTLVVQVRQNLHLVLGGQLLQNVREAFILQLGCDFDHALIAHLVDSVREVGGLGVLVVRHERSCRLRFHVSGEHRLVPVDNEGLLGTAAPRAGGGADAGNEQLGHAPVAVAALLNGDVLNDGVAAAVEQAHAAVKELTHDESLRVALFEAAQVHKAG